jgi:threonine dehydratase
MTAEPTPDSVERAARRLGGVAVRTPTLTSERLDEHAQAAVFCKAEVLQRTGSFKLRGAWNAIAALDPDVRGRGVLTYSSGNHGRALAFAARVHGVPATVLLPTDAPSAKRRAILREGATLVPYDPATEDRAEAAEREAAARGMTLIAPYDHREVIAGQGTAARELLQDAPALDVLIAPLGGGGLLAGCALAAAERETVQIVGVDPAALAKTAPSLTAGRPVGVPTADTIADAQRATAPGALTFPILQKRRARILTVDDDQLRAAMRFAFHELGVVCEPSGAAALAAVLSRALAGEAARIGLVLSGSNISVTRFASLTTPAAAGNGGLLPCST